MQPGTPHIQIMFMTRVNFFFHAEVGIRDLTVTGVQTCALPISGKTIIPDPRVRAQITLISQTAMTPAAFYEAFLALLQVHQFVAVESGGIIRILPDANARQMPNIDLPDGVNGTSEQLVTQIIAVQ